MPQYSLKRIMPSRQCTIISDILGCSHWGDIKWDWCGCRRWIRRWTRKLGRVWNWIRREWYGGCVAWILSAIVIEPRIPLRLLSSTEISWGDIQPITFIILALVQSELVRRLHLQKIERTWCMLMFEVDVLYNVKNRNLHCKWGMCFIINARRIIFVESSSVIPFIFLFGCPFLFLYLYSHSHFSCIFIRGFHKYKFW